MQFGMLIEFLFEKFPDTESVTETAIGDLQVSCLVSYGLSSFTVLLMYQKFHNMF